MDINIVINTQCGLILAVSKYIMSCNCCGSDNSVIMNVIQSTVGEETGQKVVTRRHAERSRVTILAKARDFSRTSWTALQLALAPIQCIPRTLSPGVMWPVHELDHSISPWLRIRMRGAITLFRPYILPWLAQKYPRIQKMTE